MSFTTHTGNRGLVLEEKLIFEMGEPGRTGVDLPKPAGIKSRLGGLDRDSDVGLPGLSEPQVVRHFTRLSQKNFGIDSGFFPLGSCTMKHNPRLNEKVARMPGLADLHPMQPESTVQGALELIDSCCALVAGSDRDARRFHVARSGRTGRTLRHDGDPCGP